VYGAFFGVVDLLKNPRYAVPLVINLTGSVWFFLLIGQAGELSFTFLNWLRGILGALVEEGLEREERAFWGHRAGR
jgi:hypothetical protein